MRGPERAARGKGWLGCGEPVDEEDGGGCYHAANGRRLLTVWWMHRARSAHCLRTLRMR